MGHAARLSARRWARARRATFARDRWRCTACGRPGRLECHHVVALEDGGEPYSLANLSTLCRDCHIARHRRKLSPGVAAWRALVAAMLTR